MSPHSRAQAKTPPRLPPVLAAVPWAHVPVLERIPIAKAGGYGAMSLMPSDIAAAAQLGLSAADLAAHLADAGIAVAEMECVTFWLPGHHALPPAQDQSAMLRGLTPQRLIEAARAVGATVISVVEMLGVRPDVAQAAEAFAGICDLAADNGLRVALEFAPIGGIAGLSDAMAIIDAAGRPNGGLLVDSWHFFRSGSTLAQLALVPGERIFAVQINDGEAQAWPDAVAETMAARLLPGEGHFDLTGWLRTLDAIGCTAPLTVEIFSKHQRKAEPQDFARRAAAATEKVLQAAREGGQ